VSVAIHIALDARSAAYVARLKDAPAAAQREIARAIDRENLFTVGVIQKEKLSRRGPKTLGVVTNRLRGSMRASKTEILADGSVRSTIGSNVVYAGIHEFGFSGDVTVRSHSRRVFEHLSQKTRAVMDLKTGKITKEKIKPKQTGVVMVRSHTRHMQMPERAFIRSTIEARTQKYSAAISGAVVRILSSSK
jgi:phage gpG-like protein